MSDTFVKVLRVYKGDEIVGTFKDDNYSNHYTEVTNGNCLIIKRDNTIIHVLNSHTWDMISHDYDE